MQCSALLCAFQTLLPRRVWSMWSDEVQKWYSWDPPVQKPRQTDPWSGLACTPRLPSLSAMKCESSRAFGVMINLDTCTQLTLPGINLRMMFFNPAEASCMSPSRTRGRVQRDVSSVVCLDASSFLLSSSLPFSSEVPFMEF